MFETTISVSPAIYPAPVSITLTSISLPFLKIGVNTHPIPDPKIVRSTLETYSLPGFNTITSVIFPFEMTGCTWASLPLFTVIFGFLMKFIISLVPYCDPPSWRLIEDTSPLKIGSTLTPKVSFPMDDIPINPSTVTLIGG